jgi:hypothetical protein
MDNEIMNPLKSRLFKLEARLQALIEGSAARLFPLHPDQDVLATRLIKAMRDNIKSGHDGGLIAPNLFIIEFHPDHIEAFKQHQDLIANLAQTIKETGSETGLRFLSLPSIRLQPNHNLDREMIQVRAEISLEKLAQTTDLVSESTDGAFSIPTGAFLIVNGMNAVPLEKAVINIGRRPDNDLVVDDGRVSRTHAQIRSINQQFVIFDLDSTGGTFVNGEQVNQCVLIPGDVISLAGVPMVYGQDSDHLGETQKM